jgi:hypothetical protein
LMPAMEDTIDRFGTTSCAKSSVASDPSVNSQRYNNALGSIGSNRRRQETNCGYRHT